MLRQQVLGLYRKIFRTINEISDPQTRIEVEEWARDDFKRNKHVTEEATIKMLLIYGDKCLKELQTNINLAK